MGQQFEVNNRLRIEAEAKAARLQEENEKMYTNYDVLKEHELNIIKDFQDRRKADQKRLDDQIEELKRQLSEKDTQINTSQKQINDLEGQLRKQQFETERVHEQKTLQSDAQVIIQSKLDREIGENNELRSKIQHFEREMEKDRNLARQEANEKKLAYAEIK